jgi:hypothetical protein
METRRLDRAEWKSFFDIFSDMLTGKRAEIEITSHAIGDQIEAAGALLKWLTYDPKNDIIEIALEHLDHMIYRPIEVYLAFGPEGIAIIEVTDREGVQRIIKLSNPYALPSPLLA